MVGCSEIQMNNHYDYEERTSINDHFGENITSYQIEFVKGESECLGGTCKADNFDEKTTEKDCYFCKSALITENKKRLELTSDRWQSGGMDASFGCVKKFSGEEKNGFDIISISDYEIKAKGKISTYYSQNGTKCDKVKDPDCSQSTYGNCAGGDYSQKFTREVILIFEN